MTTYEAEQERRAAVLARNDLDGTTRRFLEYAYDSGNWGGQEHVIVCVGGNVGGDPEDKGFLTNMKKRGWITTQVDCERNDHGEVVVCLYFTDEGIRVIDEYGI